MGWNKYKENQVILTESDKRVLAMLNAAYKANGNKLAQVSEALFVSRVMVRYILNGSRFGLSYYRYLPKTLAFLKACNCRMRIEAYPIKDDKE